MRLSRKLGAGSISIMLAFPLLLTACSGGDGQETGSSTNDANEQAPEEVMEVLDEALAGPDGKDERVFGTSDDDVLTVVEQTLESQNATADWNGSDLVVALDGSVEDLTATSPCLMLEAFLKDGEDAVLHYSDGEVRCSES